MAQRQHHTNANERLHDEFKRRIKTQRVLPSAETAAMLFWASLAFGRISLRKGWLAGARKKIHRSAD
jgi:transposase-like protein